MKKNNLRLVSLLCALVLCTGIVSQLMLKPAKAETINDKIERYALPIFTFFTLGITTRSKRLTDSIGSEINDIKFMTKNWWDSLGTIKQNNIIQKVEYKQTLDISDYQEYGLSVIKDYSNIYDYKP